ncbi:hypothetical protein [Actinopolymorpha singaporensis]|uniref:Uncharacterized protein n=1 Tax=Actinopolymorpha singaporensis TaxID=117157 RepID=A0A1H1MMS3_9ACTN|nr:hypothetical protein [Actinopolymorpha singaporensis]SDR88084.1 hypothetical protein SAMN04489717_0893 [Actinopolymorpha singaporensis]
MADDQRTSRRGFLKLAAGTAVASGMAPVVSALAGGMAAASTPLTDRGGTMTPDPYARWANGPCPRPDPSYFPIGVWLQEPALAPQYQQAGINLYVGLWQGPTEEQLTTLAQHGMAVIAHQNDVGLARGNGTDNPLVGWAQMDEPDNAQPLPGGGYGPPVDPAVIVDRYRAMARADRTRPVFLNLGRGVADDDWIGRGPDASLDDYPKYVRGADVVSFDVYPVADGLPLWLVAKGVDRLRAWSGGRKVVWNFVETTNISGDRQVTPHQFRAEVWMSLVHGSRGILYFVHRFAPEFDAARLLHDPVMLAAVTRTNALIRRLAPVLNRPSMPGAVEVTSSDSGVPVDTMVKRLTGETYVFAVAMRDAPTVGHFVLGGAAAGASRVHVVDENRTVAMTRGRFSDAFDGYGVHIYRIVHPR